MGASESRSQQEADNDGITPQDDYYTILEVDENATADEIRVSFSPLQHDGEHLFFFWSLFCAVMEDDDLFVAGRVSEKVIIVTAFVPTSRTHSPSRQEPR